MNYILITAKRNSKQILYWLLEPPLAIIPSFYLFDKTFSFFSKLILYCLRIFLRIIIGKEKENNYNFIKK